jgi:hypothetical protein
MGPDGVGMKLKALGDLGSGQRTLGSGQLQVDGVTRVVAERFEHWQPVHDR